VGSHSFTAKYSGDSNFKDSTSSALNQVVKYNICLLYDPQKATVNAGSTLPIKVYLCDANNQNVSSSSLSLKALSVDGASLPIKNSRKANPNDLFRFNATLTQGGGYLYNLSTTGLKKGTHTLTFSVSNDTATTYTALFIIK
jgi:hypothetical protein